MKRSSARRSRDPNSGKTAVVAGPAASGAVAPVSAPVWRSDRVAGGPAAEVARFTESVSFDWRLWRQDIRGSRAHAAMLKQAGLLRREELKAIERGLEMAT